MHNASRKYLEIPAFMGDDTVQAVVLRMREVEHDTRAAALSKRERGRERSQIQGARAYDTLNTYISAQGSS